MNKKSLELIDFKILNFKRTLKRYVKLKKYHGVNKFESLKFYKKILSYFFKWHNKFLFNESKKLYEKCLLKRALKKKG